MARDDLHFRLRIPQELKAQIEDAAEQNRRSMTAEIVARLEESFSGRFESLDREYQKNTGSFARMERSLERLLRQFNELRLRTEYIATDPSRLPPERVARRAAFKAFHENPEGPYVNPYQEGNYLHEEFEKTFRQMVIRSFYRGNTKVLEVFSELIGDRREAIIDHDYSNVRP